MGYNDNKWIDNSGQELPIIADEKLYPSQFKGVLKNIYNYLIENEESFRTKKELRLSHGKSIIHFDIDGKYIDRYRNPRIAKEIYEQLANVNFNKFKYIGDVIKVGENMFLMVITSKMYFQINMLI